MQCERELSKQIAPATGNLAVALLTFIAIGTDVAVAAPKEVLVEKNVSTSSKDLGLEECKKKLILSVGVSQARLFRIENQIVRTSASDPGIAEPVVVSPNQLYILGRSSGITTITLWDDGGQALHMQVRVEENEGLLKSTISAFRNDIDQRLLPSGEKRALTTLDVAPVNLEECSAAKHSQKHQYEISTSTPPPQPLRPFKLPQEDTLTITSGEKTDRIMIRSGFSCENYSPSKTLDLIRSQSRVFRVKNGLKSTTINQPGIAEPIVVSKHAFVLLGKAPGKAVLVLHDELDNEEAYNLRVRRNANPVSSTISAIRGVFLNKILHIKSGTQVPPINGKTLELAEIEATKTIDLEPSHPRLFKTQNSIVRTVVSDPNIAAPVVVSSTDIALLGRAHGKATLFIWDDAGCVSSLNLSVTEKSATTSKSTSEAECVAHSATSSSVCEVECWSGHKKDVLSVSDTSKNAQANAAPILSVTSLASLPIPKFPDRVAAITLNNEGVRALVHEDFDLAIRKLQSALRVDPTYQRALSNLAIAYNNLGLSLNKENPAKAMKQFHNAVYLDPKNITTVANWEGIIRIMGRDPSSFEDRVDLGDQAVLANDIAGGIIEYKAALEIRDDAAVRAKLNELTSKIERQ